MRRRALIHCPGGGVHFQPRDGIAKIPDTDRYAQNQRRFQFVGMPVQRPADSRWRAISLRKAGDDGENYVGAQVARR